MPDLQDGESIEIKGSAARPYVIKNVGGVYSCSCPAWRNQSLAIEQRTCKHIRRLRGEAAEKERVGSALAPARAGKVEKAGPPLLLAETWDNATDLSDWWMSEKLDGVRAYWDGKQLLSRQGNVYHAPDWFLKGLPSTALDGELWMDRKSFQKTVSIVRRQDKSDHWKQIRFLLFDAPEASGDFESRLEFLKEAIRPKTAPHAEVLQHQVCEGLAHLQRELARVESLGGEGLMLRQPRSAYAVGRSSTLLKVKTFHDAEATVLDHQAGKGRHKGRLGALLVQLDDGTEFAVGTGFSDAQRQDPPPIGSKITFRYQELSDGGVPRFPSFVRVCRLASDLSRPKTVSSSPAASGPAAAAETSPAATRRFEFSEGKSNKFWEITVDGADVAVRYGRINSNGQANTKSFADAHAAAAHAEKLIEEKTGKGYREV